MIVKICKTGAAVFSLLFVVSLVLWILKKRKFKQTKEYIEYMEYKRQSKV